MRLAKVLSSNTSSKPGRQLRKEAHVVTQDSKLGGLAAPQESVESLRLPLPCRWFPIVREIQIIGSSFVAIAPIWCGEADSAMRLRFAFYVPKPLELLIKAMAIGFQDRLSVDHSLCFCVA